MMSEEGLSGNVYQIQVAHQNYVGDKREHTEPYNECWCWDDDIKRKLNTLIENEYGHQVNKTWRQIVGIVRGKE